MSVIDLFIYFLASYFMQENNVPNSPELFKGEWL